MNFLFINHHANAPKYGNPYRTYAMAKALVRGGHKVTIVASSYSHLRLEQPPRNFGITCEVHDGITYLFLPSICAGNTRLAKVLNIFSFVFFLAIYRNAIQSKADPDIVIEGTTYILPIIISYRISRLARAKLIYEVRDLWPASPIEISGKSKNHPFFLLISWVQKYALQHADCVVSTLRYADQYFTKEVIPPKMFAHIQNGVDAEQYSDHNITEGDTFHAIQKIKAKFSGCVGYTGGLGAANAVQSLLAAAEELARHDVAVILVGKGPRRAELNDYVANRELSNVFIFDAVTKSEVIPITRSFDLAFAGGVERRVHHYGISPNKVFDYMMSETPILLCYNTQDDFVERLGCGITVNKPTGSTVATAAMEFFALSDEQKQQMGWKGRRAVLEQYEYQVLAGALLNVVDRLTDNAAN